MLVWFILFFVIILVSFILALRSLGDYYEQPVTAPGFSLFLIRNPKALTESFLQQLYNQALAERSIVSLERLFKGPKQALVVSGPTDLFKPYIEAFDLLELEDYSKRVSSDQLPDSVLGWEVGTKKNGQVSLNIQDIITQMPTLDDGEEFWWQIVLQPVAGNLEQTFRQVSGVLVGGGAATKKVEGQPMFQSVVRAVVWAKGKKRAETLQNELTKIGSEEGLARLPQIYSSSQIVKFYQDRALHQFGVQAMPLNLTVTEVLSLLGLLAK
jgi:hypothetical protein